MYNLVVSSSPSLAELIAESRRLAQEGEVGAALERARCVLEQARVDEDCESIIAALLIMGDAHYRLGHYGETRSLAEEVLARAPADAPARADALRQLGACAMETESAAKAEELFLRAADVAREIGYAQTRMRALHDLAAGIYTPRGQFDLALAAADEACSIASALNLRDVSFPLVTSTWICLLTGQHQRARASLDRLDQVVAAGSLQDGYRCWLAALLVQDEGNLQVAASLYAQTRSIAEKVGDPALNIFLRLGLSGYHRILGSASAYEWANDAVAIATRASNRRMWGRALIERARAAWLCGHPADAEADLRAAVADLSARHAAFDLARARLLLAAFLHQQQRDEAAAVLSGAAQGIIAGGYAFLLDQERALAFPLLAAFLNSSDRILADRCATLVEHLMRVPPESLRIVTLGSYEIWQGRRVIGKRVLRRHAGELFALLLLNPSHSLSSEQFFEALCPEQKPDAANAMFHHATSTLRRALEPELPDKFPSRYLEVEEGRVTLHLPSGSSVDFESFEMYCQRAEWEAALALYSGEFLPEYLYAEWATTPRLRLTQLYLRALLAVAEQKLSNGLFQEVLDACRRVLAIEPWQEQAVLLGMQACLGLNDRAQARRLYRNLENSLRQDLNTEPPKELQLLYQSLGGRMRNKTE